MPSQTAGPLQQRCPGRAAPPAGGERTLACRGARPVGADSRVLQTCTGVPLHPSWAVQTVSAAVFISISPGQFCPERGQAAGRRVVGVRDKGGVGEDPGQVGGHQQAGQHHHADRHHLQQWLYTIHSNNSVLSTNNNSRDDWSPGARASCAAWLQTAGRGRSPPCWLSPHCSAAGSEFSGKGRQFLLSFFLSQHHALLVNPSGLQYWR